MGPGKREASGWVSICGRFLHFFFFFTDAFYQAPYSFSGKVMNGHKMWVTSLSWEPYHSNPDCRYFVSSSKDCDLRIWDSTLGQTVRVLAGHTKSVTCVKWGGGGLIYSASQDRSIKVWRATDVSL